MPNAREALVMKVILFIALAAIASTTWLYANKAEAEKAFANMDSDSLTVVELFTSQGCSSCPPADRVLAELATQHSAKVLPLSFHVDYWNYIGWKDPYSSKENTQRQYNYRQTFRRSNVYTPQAVVNGVAEMNGASRSKLLQSIADNATINGPKIKLTQLGQHLQIAVSEGQGNGQITLIEYDPQHTTEILRGENRGETLTNYNIVTSFRNIGEWNGKAIELKLPSSSSKGVAVILQTKPQGRIIAAAKL